MCGYDLANAVISVLSSVLFVVMMSVSSDFVVHGKASSVSIVCVKESFQTVKPWNAM